MKKQFALALAVIGAVTMFTSCSDSKDDPIVPGSNLEAKTYTTDEGLALTVDGTPTLGQTVQFTPAADGTATVTVKGEPIDLLSLIPDIMSTRATAGTGLAFPTSSVIPGSAEVTFTVTLAGDADNSTFTGNGDTDYCTFAYSGEVSKDAMTLNLSGISLKNTSMAGTYNTHEFDNNFFNVLRVEWKSTKGVEIFPGAEMPAADVVRMALGLPMISQGDGKDPIAVAAMLPEILKSVTLGTDGSVTAKYADTEIEGMPVKDAPKGLARYVVKDDHTLLLFLDPQAIITNTVTVAQRSRALDISSLLEGLVTNVVPMLSNGVPVSYGPRIISEENGESIYDTDPNAVCFYLGTETLLPILKVLAPVLTDDEIIESIVSAASQDPNMGMMAAMLPSVLKSLPAAIETTSKIEVGINLFK